MAGFFDQGVGVGMDRAARGFMDAFNSQKDHQLKAERQKMLEKQMNENRAFRESQAAFNREQTNRRNGIEDLTRQANGLAYSGQLQGDMGPFGRTPQEMESKYGSNPLNYVSPGALNFQTNEQKADSALNLYGKKKIIDAATTPKKRSPLVQEFVDVYGRNPTDAAEVLNYVQMKKGKPKTTGPDVKSERDLRKEFSSEAEYFKKINNSYQTIRSIAKEDSAAGDIGLVFGIMKMFDPGSVVRESEFATAQNAAGVPDRVRAQYNKIISGQRLTPEQRADFVGVADRIYQGQEQSFSQKRSFYSGLAKQYGMDPERIVYDFAQQAESGRNSFTSSETDPLGIR